MKVNFTKQDDRLVANFSWFDEYNWITLDVETEDVEKLVSCNHTEVQWVIHYILDKAFNTLSKVEDKVAYEITQSWKTPEIVALLFEAQQLEKKLIKILELEKNIS